MCLLLLFFLTGKYKLNVVLYHVLEIANLGEKSDLWNLNLKINLLTKITQTHMIDTHIYTCTHTDMYVSLQFSHSVVSSYFWPHELQHAKPPCPSPTPRADANSYPLNWWCHPTISSSVVPFSCHLQSFPVSRYFPMCQLLASGGQSTGVSASSSVFPMNIKNLFPLGWTGWISLQFKGLSRVCSNTTV